MPKFRSKPIEAYQYLEGDTENAPDWFMANLADGTITLEDDTCTVILSTTGHETECTDTDWVVWQEGDIIDVLTDELFQKRYEAVE